jgi:ribosomal protein S27E
MTEQIKQITIKNEACSMCGNFFIYYSGNPFREIRCTECNNIIYRIPRDKNFKIEKEILYIY